MTSVSSPPANTGLLKGGLALALLLILGLGYHAYSSQTTLQSQIDVLQKQLENQSKDLKDLGQRATDMGADIGVVTKRVTAQELNVSRRFAEQLKAEQEKADAQLANELATKATATEVAAVRQEASTKAAEVQQAAETRIGSVSGEVKTVAANLDATKRDLADSRREITDVKSSLSAQISKNAGELADLRK